MQALKLMKIRILEVAGKKMFVVRCESDRLREVHLIVLGPNPTTRKFLSPLLARTVALSCFALIRASLASAWTFYQCLGWEAG